MLTELHQVEQKHHQSYRKEAAVYDQKRFERFDKQLVMSLMDQALRKWLRPSPDLFMLDVATGTCRAAIEIARQGATVVGVDLTEEMLKTGQAKLKELGISSIYLHRANGRELPFKDNSFDHVMSLRFMHLIPCKFQRLFIDEMMRVLKPGGLLIVEFNNPFYGGLYGFYLAVMNWIRLGQKPPGRLWPHQISKLFSGIRVIKHVGLVLPGLGRIGGWSWKWAMRYGRLSWYFPFNFLSATILFICRKERA